MTGIADGSADSPDTTLDKGRVEAFSDAVIAVAATILVLELHPPEEGEDVWQSLSHQGTSLVAYVISFLTILIIWVNHHALFQSVARVNRPMLFVNGLLLLGISFISYTTAAIGPALHTGQDGRAAALLYALVLCLTSACFTGLWWCLRVSPGLLLAAARPRLNSALRRSLAGPIGYAIAGGIAVINATAALVTAALIAGYFAFFSRYTARKAR